MAVTINVNGFNSGGGNRNPTSSNSTSQPTTQSVSGSQQQASYSQNLSGGSQNISSQQTAVTTQYQRPDVTPYLKSQVQQGINTPLPTSDRLVNDVRAEISRRGVLLIPGTQNFTTMLNTLHQNQRSSLMGQINAQYDLRMTDIDNRRDALMLEISNRYNAEREDVLRGVKDPLLRKKIDERYDKNIEWEEKRIASLFESQYNAVEEEQRTQSNEAEDRLTEALQRLTEELSQGNKDSYLNNLRDKYKEQIWRRDNASTEDEVREAGREAAKIQERMQRAMSPNSGINWGVIATTAIGGMANMANIYAQGERLEDQRNWGLPIQMSRAILSGNAYSAYAQQASAEQQRIENNWTLGGAALGAVTGIGSGILTGMGAGAALGSAIPGFGTAIGAIVGTAIGAATTILGAQGGYFFGGGRELEREKKKADAADLWSQVEGRMTQFNGLAMMLRPFANGSSISSIRDFLINQANESDGSGAFVNGDDHLDLYDLGYTAPEFAQQIVNRVRARGFSKGISDAEYALRQDALERYYNMSPNSLTALSAYDRFGSNDANQDFINLVTTLSSMNTLGMSGNGGYIRGEEFAGYMTQLGQQQRSAFLTVDNARSGRQIATGQALFGTRFGAEAMQGIQQVNNTIQNPRGGFAQTLLYDVIQELYPETRGRIDKIEQAQYDPDKQNRIQQEYQRRIQSIYGGVDTTAGYLAAQEIWGIQNPNIMMPIVRQLGKRGGLEAHGLKTGDVNSVTDVLNNEGYTPAATQRLRNASDQQTAILLKYQDEMKNIASDILAAITKDVREKLDEAVKELKKVNN